MVWHSHLFKNFPVCCDPHKDSLVQIIFFKVILPQLLLHNLFFFNLKRQGLMKLIYMPTRVSSWKIELSNVTYFLKY